MYRPLFLLVYTYTYTIHACIVYTPLLLPAPSPPPSNASKWYTIPRSYF